MCPKQLTIKLVSKNLEIALRNKKNNFMHELFQKPVYLVYYNLINLKVTRKTCQGSLKPYRKIHN